MPDREDQNPKESQEELSEAPTLEPAEPQSPTPPEPQRLSEAFTQLSSGWEGDLPEGTRLGCAPKITPRIFLGKGITSPPG